MSIKAIIGGSLGELMTGIVLKAIRVEAYIYDGLCGVFPQRELPRGNRSKWLLQTEPKVAATFEGADELTADILVGVEGACR